MMKKKNSDHLIKFMLFGVPVIAVLGVIVYGKISGTRDEFSVHESSSNPFEYDISALKKVDPGVVRYNEDPVRIPLPFKAPSAFTIRKDRIYAAGNNIVVKLDLTGKVLKEYKIDGVPVSIDVSEAGDIALCFEKGVVVLDSKGSEVFSVKQFSDKSMLTSLALAGDYLYVTDAGRAVLLQLTKRGEVMRQIGRRDRSAGVPGFIVPSSDFDVISGRDSTVWAVNPGRHQLENYTSDGSLRSSWSAPATGIEGFSGCCNPTRIVLLDNGDFVTAEKHIVRVKIYSPAGIFKCVVAAPDKFKDGTRIVDIAADSTGKIYLLDSATEGIRVFKHK
jgi:hypothetical protein